VPFQPVVPPPHRAVRSAAIALLAVLLPLPAAAQLPQGTELLIDVRLERGPSGLAYAQAMDGTVLFALSQILQLAEVRITAVIDGSRVEAVLEPAGLPLVVDTDSGFVRRGALATPIPPGTSLWEGGLLFLETAAVARLLDVGASLNLAELTLTIRNADHLPAVRRAERQRRQALLRAPGDVILPASERLIVPPVAVDGAVLDWSAALGTTAPRGPGGLEVESGALRLGLGVGVLGGSGAVLHEEHWLPGGVANVRTTDVSWIRAWPRNPMLRQARIGEVAGTGRQPRQIQGAAFTNAPFVRPVTFATGTLVGALLPGWEVELYRQGSLVGLTTTRADGAYAFDVPLVYGTNPVEVVGYGPTGEVRRLQRTFEVPFERLTAGQFEYGIGGGGCGLDPCQATVNLDLRYGASSRLTVRAGWDQFWRDTLPDLWHPYASATFQAARAVALFGEVVGNAQVSGLATFAPSADVQAGVGHTHFVGDSIVAPLVGTTMLNDLTTSYLFVRPGIMDGRFFVRADARRAYGTLQRSYDARVTATAQIPDTRLDAGVRINHASLRQAPFTTTAVLTGQVLYQVGPAFGPLRRTIVRGGMEWDPARGVERVSGGIARALLRDYYVDGAIAWSRDNGVEASLTFKASLPSARITSQNRIDDFGAVGLQSAEGSLLYDRAAGRVTAADGRGIGRSGVSGTVFLDDNGNGRFDPGEQPVPGALIRVGPWVIDSDESGRYTVWDVVPFEQLVIEVDPNSAGDPLWVPAALRYVLYPDPNRFAPVDIPFVQTAEVMGRLLLQPSGRPVPSTEVLLVPDDGGEPIRTVTFADGGFYVMGVRPGRYRVTLGPEVQEAYGVVSEDAVFTVEPGRTSVVEGIVVSLWKVGGER